MIFVMIRLFDIELWVMVRDLDQFPIEVLPELCGDDGVTVFGRKDDVVVTEIYAVIVMSVVDGLGHALIVAWRGDWMQDSLHPRANAPGYLCGIKNSATISHCAAESGKPIGLLGQDSYGCEISATINLARMQVVQCIEPTRNSPGNWRAHIGPSIDIA